MSSAAASSQGGADTTDERSIEIAELSHSAQYRPILRWVGNTFVSGSRQLGDAPDLSGPLPSAASVTGLLSCLVEGKYPVLARSILAHALPHILGVDLISLMNTPSPRASIPSEPVCLMSSLLASEVGTPDRVRVLFAYRRPSVDSTKLKALGAVAFYDTGTEEGARSVRTVVLSHAQDPETMGCLLTRLTGRALPHDPQSARVEPGVSSVEIGFEPSGQEAYSLLAHGFTCNPKDITGPGGASRQVDQWKMDLPRGGSGSRPDIKSDLNGSGGDGHSAERNMKQV